MNYKFNKSLIYDDAVWNLAIDFIVYYEFILEQIERSKNKNSIIYQDNIIMKFDESYKNILSEYKEELKVMNKLIEITLHNENFKKYVEGSNK
jgi:predicted O-methyltransferase YrrM